MSNNDERQRFVLGDKVVLSDLQSLIAAKAGAWSAADRAAALVRFGVSDSALDRALLDRCSARNHLTFFG
jgi:hypothetical protein